MVAEGAERVRKNLYPKRGRRSIITVGGVQVTIIPVSHRGRKAWEIEMPLGGTIDHADVTKPVTLDLSTDNPQD